MEDSVTSVVCAVVVAVVIARRRRRRRNRSVWVREWIKNRPSQGAYHQLMEEIQFTDANSYKHFLRIDVDTFQHLLSRVGILITYSDTHLRRAISPGERLALTLRFLATGKC